MSEICQAGSAGAGSSMRSVPCSSSRRASWARCTSRRAAPKRLDATRADRCLAVIFTPSSRATVVVAKAKPGRSGQQQFTTSGVSVSPARRRVRRELDGLVDRRLLGDGDDHRPGAGRVRQQGRDLIGLIAQRAATDHLLGGEGRSQERRRVSRWRCIDDDQVGRPGAFELLDLAEHQEVLEARCRCGDDVE